jgi:pimeloyl-ACP methyl ester carboxylesterase
MPDQADLVAEALRRLGVRKATVVGHSLGGTVGTALAERSPELVAGLVIVDQAPDESYGPGLPFLASLSFLPVIGDALWQVTPDLAVKDGLAVAFAPGYEVPDRFVEDFNRMTYTSYTADGEEGDYSNSAPLDRRLARAGTRLLAIFGAEDQIYDSPEALAAYGKVPGSLTASVPGAGHSPNVERPLRTAGLVERFADGLAAESRRELQNAVQNRNPVRPRP